MLVEGKGEIGIPAMEPDVLKFSIFYSCLSLKSFAFFTIVYKKKKVLKKWKKINLI